MKAAITGAPLIGGPARTQAATTWKAANFPKWDFKHNLISFLCSDWSIEIPPQVF